MALKEVNLLEFLKQFPYKDEVKWQGYVYIVNGKADKKSKLSERLVAISKHNLLVFREKKVDIDVKLNLLELEQIENSQDGYIIFSFKRGRIDSERCQQTKLLLQIKIEPRNSLIAFITCIRKCIRDITLGFPDNFFSIKLDPTDLEEIEQKDAASNPSIIACGLLNTYYALCDLRKIKPNKDFTSIVTDLYVSQSHNLDISELPFLYDKEAVDHVYAIVLALQHNTYFQSFIIQNSFCPQISKYICNILKYNQNINRLILTNINAIWNSDFGGSLLMNDTIKLSVLDISNNEFFASNGVAFMANFLKSYKHKLKVLNIANMKINPEGISLLIEAFNENINLSLSLEELDISQNEFNDKTISNFGKLLSEIGSKNAELRKLGISKIGTGIGKLCSGLKKLPYLQNLNLAANKFDKNIESKIISFAKKSYSLKELILNECNLSGEGAKHLFEALITNYKLNQLDLSNNFVGEKGAEMISSIIHKCKNLQILNFSNMGFGLRGSTLILENLPDGIIKLNMDYNLSFESHGLIQKAHNIPYIPKHIPISPLMIPFCTAFGNMLEKVVNLKALSMRGSNRSKVEQNLAAIFKIIKYNTTLIYLDISNHECGSVAFEKLCRALIYNTTLKTVIAEGNKIGEMGYLHTRNTLLKNENLLSFRVISPIFDSNINPETNQIISDIIIQNGIRSRKSSGWDEVIVDESEKSENKIPSKLGFRRSSFISDKKYRKFNRSKSQSIDVHKHTKISRKKSHDSSALICKKFEDINDKKSSHKRKNNVKTEYYGDLTTIVDVATPVKSQESSTSTIPCPSDYPPPLPSLVPPPPDSPPVPTHVVTKRYMDGIRGSHSDSDTEITDTFDSANSTLSPISEKSINPTEVVGIINSDPYPKNSFVNTTTILNGHSQPTLRPLPSTQQKSVIKYGSNSSNEVFCSSLPIQSKSNLKLRGKENCISSNQSTRPWG